MSVVKPALTVTVDLEDPRPRPELPRRYPAIVDQLLARFAARGVRATFFVVDEVARATPELICAIAAAGHEIACHGDAHVPLPQRAPAEFERGTGDARERLEALCGRAVIGYRAPVFSLTAAVPWVPAVLQRLGFAYSSSVLPGANPLHGYPGARVTPFRWPEGLLEIPVPLAKLGPWRVPFLGGFYLRYLPWRTIQGALAHAPAEALLWSYCHAYDFDAGERFYRMRGTSLAVSLLLWANRRGSWERLGRLLDSVEPAPPFAERLLAAALQHAPVFAG